MKFNRHVEYFLLLVSAKTVILKETQVHLQTIPTPNLPHH